MLAAIRSFNIGDEVVETPLLVPSFSSRGFSNVAELVRDNSQYTLSCMLISAYDIYHNDVVQGPLSFAELVIIDSGGYEMGGASDFGEVLGGQRGGKRGTWRENMQISTIENSWDFAQNSTVLVPYDNPNWSNDERPNYRDQLKKANNLKKRFPKAAIDFLIKPGPKFHLKRYPNILDVTAVVQRLPSLSKFPIIGVTEKELGRTLIDRMLAISMIRDGLDRLGSKSVIHVFGSLDPISSSLYFASGADIFDGLTWLRYGYFEGNTLYNMNAAANQRMFEEPLELLRAKIYLENLSALKRLRLKFQEFCVAQDPRVFTHNSDLFVEALRLLQAKRENQEE